nr:hypothetical protein [Listeria sp. PSOL-1]
MLYWKSFFAGIGIAFLILIARPFVSSYTLSTLYSYMAMLLVIGSIICSAFVSFGGRSGGNRKKQMKWSIMLLCMAIPNFIGFIISFYF